MHPTGDTFKTVLKASEAALYKDKKSKFFGHCFPVEDQSQVKPIILQLKKQYPGANHFCYAWQIGISESNFRANDDGEPSNTAGMPIYRQIKAHGLTNILVVVVRIFGGTKLGASGLIRAYKATANLALEHSQVVTKTLKIAFEVSFPYSQMDQVMRIIKRKGVNIIDQRLELDATIHIEVRKNEAESIADQLGGLHKISVERKT